MSKHCLDLFRYLPFLILPAKRINTLKVNASSVISSIVNLPSTQHPLDDPAKFVFDTWTMPGLLAPTEAGAPGETVIYAVVHGEFTERELNPHLQ